MSFYTKTTDSQGRSHRILEECDLMVAEAEHCLLVLASLNIIHAVRLDTIRPNAPRFLVLARV